MTLQQKTICLLLLRDEIDEGLSSADMPKRVFFSFSQTVWKLEGRLYFWKQTCGAHGGCRWRQGLVACVRCAHLRQPHVALIRCIRTDSLLHLQSFSPQTLHGVSVPVTPDLPWLSFLEFLASSFPSFAFPTAFIPLPPSLLNTLGLYLWNTVPLEQLCPHWIDFWHRAAWRVSRPKHPSSSFCCVFVSRVVS